MIKTIIFDNNGVLTNSDSMDNACSFLGLDKTIFAPVWEEMAKPLDKGRLTLTEFLKVVLEYFGLDKDLAEFRRVHLGSYARKEDVIKFAEKLRLGYEIALLTNFGDHFDECNENWKLEEIFGDNLFVSCKMRMRKPNDDIYLKTLSDLCRKPEETIFIDDNKDNIETAQKLGMNAILFTNLEKLEQELGKYITI
ncbi:hypothetical protein COY62_04190 [bacterium (Candidatus Howlettbacteria) CG_4_10_14_0_8_um_filter_40_9]|nr:MAG: hypothetical protein COY62_04190 [bacterium (Candidatus Howlettbacteria) CG_4_10_14_0_8_um_filter_40_9]